MIKNRFSVLLAERGLKISRVSTDTGISRSTLNNISKNETDMIRLETINTLCKYFSITPGDFFDYEPIDIDFKVYLNNENGYEDISSYYNVDNKSIKIGKFNIDILMDITGHSQLQSVDMSAVGKEVLINIDENILSDLKGWCLDLKITFDDKNEKTLFINDIYESVKPTFHNDIYNKLAKSLFEGLEKDLQLAFKNVAENYYDKENPYTNHENTKAAIRNATDIMSIRIDSDVFLPF